MRQNEPGGSYVTEALRLRFPAKIPKDNRYVVTITAYFDESGTHIGSKFVTVAGYLALSEKWLTFEAEWEQALKAFEIEMFHMSDFANQAPPFDNWPEEKRRACLQTLLNIINRHAAMSVGFTIPFDLYDAILSDEAKTFCGGPYGLAAQACFLDIAQSFDKHTDEDIWIAYILEQGSRGAGQVLKVFQENVRIPERKRDLRLLSLGFEDKRQFLPLQAADILAYELYRALPKELNQEKPRYPLVELAKIPRRWNYPTASTLENFNKVLTIKAKIGIGKNPS